MKNDLYKLFQKNRDRLVKLTNRNKTLVSIVFLFGGLFGEVAYAESFRSLSAGQEDWVRYNSLSPGQHAFIANSPNSLGDVDIEFYDSSYNLIAKSNKFGTDRIDVIVNQAGTFYIKYRMSTCMSPFGPCAVSIDVF